MIARRMAVARWIIAVACVTTTTQHMATLHFAEEPPAAEKSVEKSAPPPIDDKNRVPVAVARDRAKVMHDIYSATLDTIHHRYFHRDTAVIPARAMEDVFAEMKRNSQVEARWIAVNLRAMSIDHEPETEFERQAARVIGGGQSEFEQIEGGYFRRATAIPLVNGCIACHEGSFRQPTKAPKFAGLVISIPVASETVSASTPPAVSP